MKAIVGGEEMTVGALERPFDVAEAHFNEVMFFTELSFDEPVITAKHHGGSLGVKISRMTVL